MLPLLVTKVHIPRRRRGLVARPRLLDRLDAGLDVPLTLVSAPAGFGKTTVLTDWLTGRRDALPAPGGPGSGPAFAWLSLDERDNDPAAFWAYVVAALQTVRPGVGAAALPYRPAATPASDPLLATLINDLAADPGEIVLVLDDVHLIESSEIASGLAFLAENLPAQAHLVLAGRADPPFPLARLRAGGRLVELRGADLRFTAAEASGYLTEAMGLPLSPAEVTALTGRTEGWIAALQLAALSLQGHDDPAGFVAGFAGDDHYVVDYLVEEVLAHQPPAVRDFLLSTSILGRISAPLGDALTGREDGREMLTTLDRANLFLVRLDERREWYRYHHLFADVLRVRLTDERGDEVGTLHRRAANWHARQGDRAEAVRHALAGGDVELAAELIELSLPELQRNRQESTMRRWLRALPDEVVRDRPALSVGYAAALMVGGDIAGVESRLRDAERRLGPGGSAPATGSSHLPGAIALYRAGLALLTGDVDGTIAHAEAALDLAGPGNDVGRGAAGGLLGLGCWRRADLDSAHRWYTDAAAGLERAGHHSDVAGCALALADIRLAQGRLGDAIATLRRVQPLVEPAGGPVRRGAVDLHVGLAGALLDRGDRAAAERHLAVATALGEHLGLPQTPYRRRVVMARVREADGDVEGAIDLIDDARRRYVGDYFPEVRPLAAVRARLLARHGRWEEALAWAEDTGLSGDDEPDYLHEFEHVTLARALAAQAVATDDAALRQRVRGFLQRLLGAAEGGGRLGSVLDILVVLTVAQSSREDALRVLRRALVHAETQGHIGIFREAGGQLPDLLAAAATSGAGSEHARRVLETARPSPPGPPDAAGLVDPLSARELDVLRLLAGDQDGPELARTLIVSVNTVRTHTKNIYAKLGVHNRRAAVRRARELGLLG